MPKTRLLTLGFLLLIFLSCLLPAQTSRADLVLIHGHILTVDARDSVVKAIAIQDGAIVKVGSDTEVLEFAGKGPQTRVSYTAWGAPADVSGK